MNRFLGQYIHSHQNGTFPLQLTSLIDMFTLILVFLLKSYSASSVNINMNKDLTLPASTSMTMPIEALQLVVSKEGIFVEEKNVVKFENGQLPKASVDARDGRFIRPLYDALNAQAEKSKSIAQKNEAVKFDGKVIFQADRDLDYQTLKKVMYTATIAGFSEFKFAVIGMQ